MAQVTIGSALSTGWSIYKHNAGFLSLVSFIMIVVFGGLNWVTNSFNDSAFIVFVLNVISVLLWTLMGAGFIHIYLGLLDGKKGTVGELFTHTDEFLPLLIVNVAVGIAVVVGSILLIIPGVIAAIFLMFAQYLVVDKKMKPMEALKQSMHMAKPNFWMLLGLLIVVLVFNTLGAMALLVGVLVTGPVSAAAIISVYRQLVGGHAAPPAAPATPAAPQA